MVKSFVPLSPACLPSNTLLLPVVKSLPACLPANRFDSPEVNDLPASLPSALLCAPVASSKVAAPNPTF